MRPCPTPTLVIFPAHQDGGADNHLPRQIEDLLLCALRKVGMPPLRTVDLEHHRRTLGALACHPTHPPLFGNRKGSAQALLSVAVCSSMTDFVRADCMTQLTLNKC